MEIQFLGTSSGTPTRSRNMTAIALRTHGAKHWSLVDCAEGTQHRLLRTSMSPMSLRAIFITHLHGDHCYGLPGLLASAGMLNRTAPMAIVGPAPLRGMMECIMEATQLTLPYPIDWVAIEDLAHTDILPDLRVHATRLSHRIDCWAYSFTEAAVERKLDIGKLKAGAIPAGPAWGEIQQGRNVVLADGRVVVAEQFLLPPRRSRKVIIAGDNDSPELLAREAIGADLLVHEATYTEAVLHKVGPGPQHSSAAMVARMAQEAALPNLILTHFSPRYQDREGALTLNDIEREAREHYTGTLFLARDLARYELGKDGSLHALQ
ncbi:MBL fold metallo-hydrolase [Massilia sp. IC2-476]|uniref:MBL fold metallo-hydrolase n=1 Tax=Massilia sp. IC2-476 TaxID=2887199 RepID=UPI001D1097B1|nr:MBL fold metallo-hydrolase [Massilia sp. IC2-476]MCC2971164.1 MBL fold metallo-hydrolase [Massilia sp. IC2-476]